MGKSKRERLYGFFNRARLYRFFAMIVMCVLGLGGFICFDSVGSLQEKVMKFMNISASEFSLMYSINSWPNVVLGLFGGFLIDRFFGIKIGAIIYSMVFSTGHLIFSLGILLGIFWLSLMGRFIFGVGMEIMFICLQCYIIVWFKGKELSTVICLMMSISRLGTSIMYEIATPMYLALHEHVNGMYAVGIVYFTVGIMTFVSIGCSFILKNMDPYKYEKNAETDASATDRAHGINKKKIAIRDVFKFPITYWFINVEYCVYSTAIFILVPFSQGFFMTHFNVPVETANNVTSFFSILSAVLAPLFGIIVDRFGKTVFFLMSGMCNLLLAHLLLTFANISPFVGMFFMSTGMAILTGAMSPMLSFIIPVHQLGTALGVNIALVNTIYSVNLLVAGTLVDKYSFTTMELFMISWSILGLISSFGLWIVDKRSTGVLNMSPAQRKQFEEAQDKKDEVKEPLNA